ncbi:tRNA (adenine-N(1)-)-methyltransferase catalytic subunit trm61 [Steccherinum ochraceum]|uniref:tRNA (adenine(58)-N(1))-methyltransferase catalytic subunit TRM61 n=1 Tax=Steccherinum ochraceum TaxID=92696 RepID=A0A4R0R5Y1_9APHY|nr:tRNA (adenine-N(1)-)-methyltransferase catalytic subunit trm61 [Steccherinum ochraceum]
MLTRDVVQPLLITPGKELNSKFGYYRHSDLIGVPYGSKIGSRNGKGFIHLLRPTPELWTLALPHRTQILYLADIAFITSWLNIKPGSRVIEAGTGSASFSHSVARTVGPSGHLWSYEFHEARAKKAKEEFADHGLDDTITLTHRNVCKDGFTVEDTVDSVFLDLPAPWEAVDHAKKALRKDRTTRICCFSPCMEQVLRTVSALNEAGFTEITMYETLIRPHQVDVVPALPTIDTISTQLKQSEARREAKRLRQIANSRQARGEKRKREVKVEPADPAMEVDTTQQDDTEAESGAAKKIKTEEDTDVHSSEHVPASSSTGTAVEDVSETTEQAVVPELKTEPAAPTKVSLSKAFPEVRGHTSYLTFAVLLPQSSIPAPQETEPVDEEVVVSAESTPNPVQATAAPDAVVSAET